MARKPVIATPTLQIRVTGPAQGRYRGSFGTVRHFTAEVQEFTDLDLSDDEIDELGNDAELTVEIASLLPPDSAVTDAVSVDPAPVEPAQVDPMPADPMPANSVPADPVPAEPAAVDPVPAEPAAAVTEPAAPAA